MYITIMQFPKIKEGKEDEFKQWFSWSAEQFSHQPVLISRRLLKPHNGGNYAVIVELDSQKDFTDMHTSPVQKLVHDRLVPLLEGTPTHQSYDLVAG